MVEIRRNLNEGTANTQYSFLATRAFATSYSYDAASNRVGFTDPEGGSTTYAYDALNRLQTLTPPSAFTTGAAVPSFGFSYDALSRRKQMTRPNGVTTNYTYDNLSRLLSVLHEVGGATIDGASYTLDNAGNRLSKTRGCGFHLRTHGPRCGESDCPGPREFCGLTG